MTGHITVEIDASKIPEILHAMMKALGNALREEASLEPDPIVQQKLRQIAAKFEAGQ